MQTQQYNINVHIVIEITWASLSLISKHNEVFILGLSLIKYIIVIYCKYINMC